MTDRSILRPQARRIGVLLGIYASESGLLASGIRDGISPDDPWDFVAVANRTRDFRSWMDYFQLEGVIAFLANQDLVNEASEAGIPCVNISNRVGECGIPRVVSDDVAIGHLGGYECARLEGRSFAFCGQKETKFTEDRYRGFVEAIREAPHEVFDSVEPRGPEARFVHDHLTEWVKSLKLPVAMLAVNDEAARKVVRACRHAGIYVPEEVAVLGVDNQKLQCELGWVRISSIERDVYQIGKESARILSELLRTGQTSTPEVYLPPLSVVYRESFPGKEQA